MAISSSAAKAATRIGPAGDQTVTIDGIRLHAGKREDALARCLELIRTSAGGKVATANLDFFALARRDPELRGYLNDSTLVVIDGAPIAWLARLLGAASAERYAGVDLVADLCRSAVPERPLRLAIVGSTADVAGPAMRTLADLSAHVEFVLVDHPPFRALSESEVAEYRKRLRLARPNLVLVALGCPKQERLIAEWSVFAEEALWVGIGGTLDFFAGKRRRAPRWVQRIGAEWVIRMAQDPRRLAHRYLVRDIPALLSIACGCVKTRFASSRSSSA
jgi:N-acetylglucosaminyldiphosphoundecaprenol N-acetyl-beta-D-mannosaminyltransferase